MPKSPACTGAPPYNSPIQIAFTYPTMRETSGLATELPTSEPASAQITYTIGSNDIPTLAGGLIPYRLAAWLWAQGQNSSGTTRTANFRLEKNGTSTATGSVSLANTNFWTLQGGNWGTDMPVVGDVLTVKLWASGAGVYLNAHALSASVTQPWYGNNKAILWAGYDATNCIGFEAALVKPSWFSGTVYSASGFNVYPCTTDTANVSIVVTTSAALAPHALVTRMATGLGRCFYADVGKYGMLTAGTSAATSYSYANYRITKLTFLPLNIKI